MAVFHSTSQAQILALLNSQGLVAGDLYYSTDELNLYLACTNQDGSVGIALTGTIMTGAIELGFNGAVGADGPAGTGSIKNIAVATANYTTAVSDDVVLANSSTPITILVTTASLDKKITTIKAIGAGVVTVQPVSGTIDGQASVTLIKEESLDLQFDGTNFEIV
jgi:hypothetical protein